MKKILILGHHGMLGNMVLTYFFLKNEYEILTTNLRWECDDFKNFIIDSNADFIINCIGNIPQKNRNDYTVNYELPLWLDKLGISIIYPDTDLHDDTPYGISKAKALKDCTKNTKVIKTSIIGFERVGQYSLLEWFLAKEGEVNGYVNQLWNGNTTLEWSKWCEKIVNNWDGFNQVSILANCDCLSKHQILVLFKYIFKKDIKIVPVEAEVAKNNCLKGDYYTTELATQIVEMKNFYKR